MGQIDSYMKDTIEVEFKKAKSSRNKHSFLTVEEVKNIRIDKIFPDETLRINRLSIIYMLDFDKNGKFSVQDLTDFAEFASKISSISQMGNFRNELEAQCTLCMWKQLTTEKGQKAFIDWCSRLFSCRMRVKVPNYENIAFVHSDIIPTLHELFQIKETYSLSPQDLTTLMQRVGEENGYMKLEDEKLDNVVPLECIKLFSKYFAEGFIQMMSNLGYSREKFIEEDLDPQSIYEMGGDSDSDKDVYSNDVSTDADDDSDQEELDEAVVKDSQKKKLSNLLKKGKSMKKIERRTSESPSNSPLSQAAMKRKSQKNLKQSQSFFLKKQQEDMNKKTPNNLQVINTPEEKPKIEEPSPEKSDLMNKINLVSSLKLSKQASTKRSRFGELNVDKEEDPKKSPKGEEKKKSPFSLNIAGLGGKKK
eukprot:gene5709-9529_t